MTLSTLVAIGKPYNVHEVLSFCREMLGTPSDTPIDTWDEQNARRTDGVKWIGNPGGIGLPAWVILRYCPDGPMIHKCDRFCATELGGEFDHDQGDIDEHARYVAETPTENGFAAIVVDFDTAYRYRGPDGESCAALHARLLTELGEWLDRRNLPWMWQNEFTGEWFDRYEGLKEFGADAS